MIKKMILGIAATSIAGIGMAVPTYAATTTTTTTHVYTGTFTSLSDLNNWLKQHGLQGLSSAQTAQIPVQKPVTSPAQTPVQKSVPASSASSSKSSSATVPSAVQQVVTLVNQQRQKNGLAPLKMVQSLDNVAQTKAQDMINENYFDHTSPKYGSPFQMMSKFGISYSYAGENIAAGQPDAATVMNDWMNSSGHRANILDPHYTEIGVGEAKGGTYGTYWVQEFIAP
jgi:uncharacterized YkwD family protein